MKIYVEGFLDTLFSILTDTPNEIKGAGLKSLNDKLKPYTATDLYKSILDWLRKGLKSDTQHIIRDKVMPLFFPKKAWSKTDKEALGITDEDEAEIRKYSDKFTDILVDFVSKCAPDVIERVDKAIADGQKVDAALSEVYMGSILDELDKDSYKVIKKFTDLYDKFIQESGIGTEEHGGGDPEKIANDAIAELRKQFSKVAVSDQDLESGVNEIIKDNPEMSAMDVAAEWVKSNFSSK